MTGLTQIQLEDSGTISEELLPGDDPVSRIPLVPSLTDKLMDSGEELLHKADHLMQRLSSLLNDENEKNIGGILSNLKSLTDKLSELQKSVDKALAGVPELTTDARKTLSNIDAMTKEAQKLSVKAGGLVDSGKNSGDALAQSTLPKLNKLLIELQSTTQQVKRVAETLENNPQELLLGPSQRDSGPGEPDYKEQQ